MGLFTYIQKTHERKKREKNHILIFNYIVVIFVYDLTLVKKYNICLYTADFILKVLGVYTRSMETIYLSLVHTGS